MGRSTGLRRDIKWTTKLSQHPSIQTKLMDNLFEVLRTMVDTLVLFDPSESK